MRVDGITVAAILKAGRAIPIAIAPKDKRANIRNNRGVRRRVESMGMLGSITGLTSLRNLGCGHLYRTHQTSLRHGSGRACSAQAFIIPLLLSLSPCLSFAFFVVFLLACNKIA